MNCARDKSYRHIVFNIWTFQSCLCFLLICINHIETQNMPIYVKYRIRWIQFHKRCIYLHTRGILNKRKSCILRTQIRYINDLVLDNILKLNLPKRILEQTLWISLWKMCKYYFSSLNVLREITFYKNNGFSWRKIKFKDLNIHA